MSDQNVYMGKISYINASPVYYGLDRDLLPPWLKMVPDVPSVLNRKIMTGQIAISPISAAFYAMNHTKLLLLPNLSISCHGKVLSVILASKYTLNDLTGKKVMFSQESASAASFLKMIFHQKNIVPNYEVGDVSDFKSIEKKADAVLVIGDSALIHPWSEQFEYCTDLGQLWYEMTQRPFVFAVWAVRKSFALKHPDLTRKIHELLLESKTQGSENLDQIIQEGKNKLGISTDRVKYYYDLLHCDLDDQKVAAMKIFFDSLYEQNVLKTKPEVHFFVPR